MPPKAGDGPPEWWDPAWPARSVEYKLSVDVTFHPSASTASMSFPWLDASGNLTAAPISSGPFSSFEVDGTKTSPNKRYPGAVTAHLEKSLGNLAVSYQFIQGMQKAVLPIQILLGGAEPADAKAGGVARIHPGPLLLANDGEDGELPRRPSEVFASLTETIGLAGIYKLDVRIFTDIPVLSVEMLRRTMPACFTVEVVRGLPNELWLTKDCEDVFVEVYPQTGSAHTRIIGQECQKSKSIKRAHNTFVKFAEPTVWLLGAAPVHAVREWLQSEALVVAVHDRDRVASGEVVQIHAKMSEQEKAAAERKRRRIEDKLHPHGLARFKLAPLLQSKSLTVGLRADVFPARGNNKQLRAETAAELKAADVLGENGKQVIADAAAVGKTEVAPEYLSSGTVCAIRATLAVPVPHHSHVQGEDQARESEECAGREERLGETNIFSASPAKEDKKGDKKDKKKQAMSVTAPKAEAKAAPTTRCRAKVAASDEDFVHGPWRASQEEAEWDEQHLLQHVKDSGGDVQRVQNASDILKAKNSLGVDRRFERYGRVVIVADDNDVITNKNVINVVRELNAKTLGINPNSADMLTRTFYDEEIANPHLDVLTGFSVLDGKCRLTVVEGLREHGLKRLLEVVKRDERPNQEGFKLLHNPLIGFSERQYNDFGAKLYQTRIRMPLERLAAKPELYSVMGKMDANTLAGMKVPATLMAIKQMERFQALREGTNFPKANDVEQLGILYGDYLSDSMMEGNPVALDAQGKQITRSARQNLNAQLTDSIVMDEGPRNPQGRTLMPSRTLDHSQTKRNIMAKTDSFVARPMATTMMKAQVLRDMPVALPDPPEARPQLDHWNRTFTGTLQMRQTASAPDLLTRNIEKVKDRSDANVHLNHILNKKQPRQTPFLDGEEVFLYSGQKLNCCEKQKAWMRESMSTKQAHTMYSYAPAYGSQNFELTEEGAESGIRRHQARCPTDTYSRLQGDNRQVFRGLPSRPKEEFRKPTREIAASRAEELNEAFVDNELHKFANCEEKHHPLKVHVRYEPSKIPHHRRITERPFDKSQVTVKGEDFGPKSMYESVHYNAHGAPGQDRMADVAGANITMRDTEANKIIGNKFMRTFAQGTTRRGVTDTDREEVLLKDAPSMVMRGSGLDDQLPTTIRTFEPYQAFGNPTVEFQARMRENDSSAPYDVATGGYIKRDPNIGMKLAVQSGTVLRAPWRHNAHEQPAKPTRFEYVSHNDFNATRMPGKTIQNESHVWKNNSRTMLASSEYRQKPFLRPKDYGSSAHLPASTVR